MSQTESVSDPKNTDRDSRTVSDPAGPVFQPMETRVNNVMLIGRNQWVIDAAERELTSPQRSVYGAVTMAELETVLTENRIDHTFVGPGLDLDLRMELIRRVFELSDFTTVHLKDFSSGPEGALAFVEAILTGLEALYVTVRPVPRN